VRRARITYSTKEMRWLEENRMMVISDYHRAFVAAFGRTDVAAINLHGLRKRQGWKVGPTKGRLTGRHWKFTAEEIAWLRASCAMDIGKYHAAFSAKFSRTDISAANLHGLRKRKGWKTGRTGRFDKGSVPWSKGKKIGNNPGSARTQFRKGEQPHNTKYTGHERLASHGYIEVSIAETNPHTGFERRYVLKHRWLWEQMHGPIPEDMVLKCKGDQLDTDPSNWDLVPRALLPRLNGRFGRGYDEAPADLKPTIMAVAKLEHSIRQKARA
jgi:hypothetical protein